MSSEFRKSLMSPESISSISDISSDGGSTGTGGGDGIGGMAAYIVCVRTWVCVLGIGTGIGYVLKTGGCGCVMSVGGVNWALCRDIQM